MARKKEPVNTAKLALLKPFIASVERDLRRIEAEVKLLNRGYQDERQMRAEGCPHTRRHAGLYLFFEKRLSPNANFPLASISWRVGNARHNARRLVGRPRVTHPRTKRVRADGKNGHYRRCDLKAAMPYAQPWEVALTFKYEKEAQKLREFCYYLQDVAKVLTWYPQIPQIPLMNET